MLKIFDMAANKENSFAPNCFRSVGFFGDSDLILITNIAESHIDSAAGIAEAARASQIV